MRYEYRLSREAETDILKSYVWYESQQEDLGEDFVKQLSEAKAAILKNPLANEVRYLNQVRGFVIKRFPYLILYIVKQRSVDLIAIFNTFQNPDQLEKRT